MQKIAALILSYAAVCGIGMEFTLISQKDAVYGNLLLVIGMYVLYRAYGLCFRVKMTKGFYILNVGMAILFSMMLTVGGMAEHMIALPVGRILCRGVFLAVALYPVLFGITSWLDRRGQTKTAEKVDTIANQKVCRLCFGIVAIMWFLGYLAMFPGVYSTDAPYWFFEFSTESVPISSQWSPMYCAFFYYLVRLGETLFGSYQTGFAVFSFVQMVFILSIIWNLLQFFCYRFHYKAVILAAAFWAFVPTHVILGLTSAQDPVFAACFAMCLRYLFELADDARSFFGKKDKPVKLALWMLLLCMIRNNGLYAMLVMTFFVIVFMRNYRKQIVLLITLVSMCVLVYQGPIYTVLGIEKGTAIREMLSFPLQQMAFVYNYDHDKLSENQIEQMFRYIPDDGWSNYGLYCLSISDPVKANLDREETRKNFLDFINLYLDILRTAPSGCFHGAVLQTFGLWYPNKGWPDVRTWHPYIEYLCLDTIGMYGENFDFSVERYSLFPVYDKILGILFGNGTDHSGFGGNLSMIFSKIPVFGMFCKVGIYIWMLIYLFFYSLYRRWRGPFIMIGLGIGILLTIMLSPVILYRYCAPVIFSAPIFLAVFFGQWHSVPYAEPMVRIKKMENMRYQKGGEENRTCLFN